MKNNFFNTGLNILFNMAAILSVSTCNTKKEHVPKLLSGIVPSDPDYEILADNPAAQLVADIRVGWNLSESLEANHLKYLGQNPTITRMETAWGNPVTTKANITTIKNAGFNAIRIPVSWDKVVDSSYNIRRDWMARVMEVVNYAVDNDMYIIVNTHHDEDIFKFTDAEVEQSLVVFKKIWEQIADNFKNYNEKLIFEGLNEPRTIGAAWEWTGGIPEEHANLNRYYQVFVDTIRASGGNNDRRMLMINTYGASGRPKAVNALTLPVDTVPNRLIVSYHAYEPRNFIVSENPQTTWDISNPNDTSPIHDTVLPSFNKFISNRIPVIMGEFCADDKNNESERAKWAEYYVSYARSKGIPCFWWGGSSRLFDRNTNTFRFPQIVTALMNGVNNTPSYWLKR